MAWTTITLLWIGLALVGGMLIGGFIHVGYGRSAEDKAWGGRGEDQDPGA